MQIPKECDVVVIGGGPAGSVAAAYLRRRGYHVVLLEKQKHPRYAVGESLIPDFWKYCDLIGASQKILDEGFVQKAGGTVAWRGQVRSHTFKDFGYDRPALHIERDRFDDILLKHAAEQGVQVFEQVAALRADLQDPDRPIVACRGVQERASWQIGCRQVIDASGQNAVLGRQLGLRQIDDAFRYMSVWGYFTNSRYIAFGGKAHPAEDLDAVPPTTFVTSLDETGDSGWGWHIALRKSTSVGLVLPREQVRSVRREANGWQSYFLQRCSQVPALASLLAEAQFKAGSLRMIRDYSYRSRRLAGPGYYLVGDAAGFIDPIFSVGVVLAMYSAFAAAWAIDRSFRSPELAAESRQLFAHQLQGRIEVARSLALPRYDASQEVSELARQAIRLERAPVQDLMHVVSLLTSRSDNFKGMVAGEPLRDPDESQLHDIDRLMLD